MLTIRHHPSQKQRRPQMIYYIFDSLAPSKAKVPVANYADSRAEKLCSLWFILNRFC